MTHKAYIVVVIDHDVIGDSMKIADPIFIDDDEAAYRKREELAVVPNRIPSLTAEPDWGSREVFVVQRNALSDEPPF